MGLVTVLASAWQLHWRAVLQLLVSFGLSLQRVDEDGLMLKGILPLQVFKQVTCFCGDSKLEAAAV